MTAQTLILDNGHTVKYQIKTVFGKSFLLIMTYFSPLDHKTLIEGALLNSTGIKQLDSVGTYDDHTGYIIYLLNKDFDEKQLFADLENNFKDYFKDEK